MQEELYNEQIEEIKNIVSSLTTLIDESEKLKNMNFGLFYQNGRLGFMDLDAFAKTAKMKLDEDGEEKTLEEIKKDIDKNLE